MLVDKRACIIIREVVKLTNKKMSKIKNVALIALMTAMPLAASAATLGEILDTIRELLDTVVPIIMVLALIYFFYGLAKYILSAGDEDAKNTGRRIMIGGIIALFVMASVWGLVNVLQDTFDVDPGDAPTVDPLLPN